MILIEASPDDSLHVSGRGKKFGSSSFFNDGCLKSAETRLLPGFCKTRVG